MMLNINGFELHYEDRGSGEPLLLLHGGTGIGSDWNAVFTGGDPDGFRVIAPDLRGHGRSTGEWLTYGVQESRDLSQLLAALRIPPSLPVGVMGGSYGKGVLLLGGSRVGRHHLRELVHL